MEINIENIKAAYEVADVGGRKMLQRLFPKIFTVQARIKTLRDACCELGTDHPFVQNARYVELNIHDINLTAFAHLRIICAALNEGWVSKPEDDTGYFPGFEFFTDTEVKEMNANAVDELCIFESKFDTKYVAVDCTHAEMLVSENFLLLKTPELAKFCGKQFIDIWMNYLLPIKKDD